MKFFIEQIPIFFPFDLIYPEQIQLLYVLKKLFDNKCHGVISIPPTIDFSISAISFFLSYNFYSKFSSKLVYCTPSYQSLKDIISKAMIFSQKTYMKFYQGSQVEIPTILPLENKEFLCINSKIQVNFKKDEINDVCNALIAPYFLLGAKNSKKQKFREKILISYKKRTHNCLHFYNYQNKKIFGSLKGVWSIDKLQKLGIKKKICPFFFLMKKIGEANVIFSHMKNIFFPKNINLFSSKNFSSSFLIFDKVFNLEKILLNSSTIQLNSLILQDSIRGLMLLRKRKFSLLFDQEKKIKLPTLSGTFSPKNFKESFLREKNSRVRIFSEEFRYSYSGAFPPNFLRFFHFFKISSKIIACFRKIFKLSFSYSWTVGEFKNYLFSEESNFWVSSENLKFFFHFLSCILSRLGVFQYRYINGLKIFSKFIQHIGIYSGSLNENIKMFFFRYPQTSSFLQDPFLTLGTIETSHIVRKLTENFKVFLICLNCFSEISLYFGILDIFVPIFGTLTLSFKKKFIFPIWTSLNESESSTSPDLGVKSPDLILIKSSIVLSRALETNSCGVICFFPTIFFLNKLLQTWEKNKMIKEIFKEKRVFIETWDPENNLLALENYKLCCDFGRSAIFLGVHNGILTKVKLKNHYRRIVLLFGNLNQTKLKKNNMLKKQVNFLNKKKVSNKIFNTWILNEEKGTLLDKLFNSKKDFGGFFVIEYEKKNKKKIFSAKSLRILGKKKNFLNLEENFKNLNKFFISWNTIF